MKLKRMRHLGKCGLCLLAVALLWSAAPAKNKYQEKFERTEKLAVDGKVILSNISGDIVIRTWDKDEVKIDAVKVSKASTEERAKENCAKVTIDVTQEGNALRIETKYPRGNKFWGGDSVDVTVNYTLMIPAKAAASVKSVSGDVYVEGTGGTVEIESVSGDIALRVSAGWADLKSVSGDIKLENINGDVNLKTVSGDVIMTGIRGSVEAESVSGDVEMTGVSEALSVKAKTLSGDAVYRGTINPKGRYLLKSHSGDIRMMIPADASFEFDAETFSGDIESEFKIEGAGKPGRHELNGVVGQDGAKIKLSTFSGDIELKKS
jgi:DUF4097 and DUF4098 domain-containing protein YvlB